MNETLTSERVSPRLNFSYFNGEAQETTFLKAVNSQRLHHAWLFTGPQGLGKATFAYRCARFLMAKQHDQDYGRLGVSPEDPEARLISARSHPDLLVLEREIGDGGKLKKNISVEAVREIGQFFSLAPSRSKYRVCIIDAVDDLNISSSNALLKILEEPPKNGVIFLIAHSSGRLLPTIKSRCRRLNFTPWHEEDIQQFINQHIEIDDKDMFRLVHLAKGAPGKALRLYQDNVLEIDAVATTLMGKQNLKSDEIMKLSNQFRVNNSRSNGSELFSMLLYCLMDQVHNKALNCGSLRAGAQFSAYWHKLAELSYQHESINLDRGDIFISIYNDLNSIT